MRESYIAYNKEERQENDLYCTNPIAVKELLKREQFDNNIWECCNGMSHISKTLEEIGYTVKKTDIENYNNEPDVEIVDFLKQNKLFNGDIITNPPYKLLNDFIVKANETVNEGNKVAFYLRLQSLGSQKRKKIFEKYKPSTIYIMSKRIPCAINGDFDSITSSAVDYCWIVWTKGYDGETKLKWI